MALEAIRESAQGGPWRATLNPPQLQAATHGDGPLLIIAGAGTGKTGTLACRVAHLLETGVAPTEILLLTFSRRAARELLARAESMSGARAGRVWGGTFHAVANRLLRLHGRALGLAPDFTVLDQADAADLMDLVREHLGVDARRRRFARKDTLAAIYSRVVNSQSPLSEVLERDYPWCKDDAEAIGEIFDGYTRRKRAAGLLDYDDLLVHWMVLAGLEPAGALMAGQFRHILVDEFQDTNALQARLLELMFRHVPNLTVVGDDAQAIYSFRAATVDNILDFPTRFAGTEVVALEQNYRSTTPLLELSNAVIELAPRRHDKTLWSARAGSRRPQLITCLDEADQARAVCRALLEERERGTPLMHQATLFRTAHHSDLLEVELTRHNIPYVKYGGLRFLEAAHVKDVVSIMRLLENPRDAVAWFRVLQLLEGVGPAAARRILVGIGVDGGGDLQNPIGRLSEIHSVLNPQAHEGVDRLAALLRDCGGSEPPPPATQLGLIREFCEPLFERRYSHADSRLRDLEQLEVLASQAPSRGSFLADLVLDPPTSTGDLAGPPLLDEDFTILSTIHSAKGSEWDVVRVIHAADGMIPSDMATGNSASIEEERRLLYVGLTRARDTLEVYFPLRYHRRPRGLEDAHGYAQVTRFLPNTTHPLMDRVSTDACAGVVDDPLAVEVVGTAAPVDDMLRRLWG